MDKILLKILTVLLLLVSVSSAANLGIATEKNSLRIGVDQTASIKILFFTADVSNRVVHLTATHPENWTVVFDNNFIINKNIGNEMLYRNGEYIFVKAIYLNITPQREGRENIILLANIKSEGSGLALNQEGQIIIEVDSYEDIFFLIAKTISQSSPVAYVQDVALKEESRKIAVYEIILFIIVVVSYLIYKRS